MIDKELQEQNEKVASKDDFPINWIDRISLFLSHTVKYLIPVIVIVMMYEIFMRYVLFKPTLWANELCLWLAVIVMDKSTDLIKAISRISYFYKHESCGQCTPCREGTGWLWEMMEKMAKGEAKKEDIDTLLSLTKRIEGHTICALGDAAAWPIQGLIRHFRHHIEDRIDQYQKESNQNYG